ncbi:hypothetical protein N781_12680 [Pontibacillus halophilus JSM 076056 = DSM 19796]|uniref:NgoFVII family restriction endonuclease n=1 Tax=Pontibacillus halophilus JSM 076056 = DSM 19796 TaxID=1385510 RepID=A0A0A5GPS8_9BACI|nr:DUF881 domain-containing protein [Pontibacillus halophilus]KGX93258.1 hypothetical protein N781_12680 [Pontibacillus halophilus JSM 076056 = DSM 19796]
MSRNRLPLSIVLAIFGFMVAIQFQSTQQPDTRDTRDLWEIRTALQDEQRTQQELYEKLSELDSLLAQYETQNETEKVETLKDSIEQLKQQAGLEERVGEGLTLTVEPWTQIIEESDQTPNVSPDLLQRLINELNRYGATDIAIGEERITSLSPIRNVNGYTYVNNRQLSSLPLTVKVLSEDPERLLNYMEVSPAIDEFAIDNLLIQLSLKSDVKLPAYEQLSTLKYLNEVQTKETGES